MWRKSDSEKHSVRTRIFSLWQNCRHFFFRYFLLNILRVKHNIIEKKGKLKKKKVKISRNADFFTIIKQRVDVKSLICSIVIRMYIRLSSYRPTLMWRFIVKARLWPFFVEKGKKFLKRGKKIKTVYHLTLRTFSNNHVQCSSVP